MTSGDDAQAAPTVFHDLDRYVAVPRLSGLALSPDGSRLVTTVSTLGPKGTSYVSALWEVDPTGARAAFRLTRSAKGEAGAAFSHDGDLYFTSARPDPDAAEGGDEPVPALWRIPAVGGEARVVLSRPGGVGGVLCARDAERTLVSAGLMAGARTETEHKALSTVRKDASVDAILHDGYPIRFWDHDLGPSHPALFVAEPDPEATEPTGPTTVDHEAPLRLRLVSEGLGRALEEQTPAVSPDGTFALTPVTVFQARGDQHTALVRIDLADGTRTTVLDDPDGEFYSPLISPDSARAVVVADSKSSPQRAPHPRLSVLDLAGGKLTPLAHEWDRWSRPVAWLPDGSAVLVVADDDGRGPVFRIEVATGEVTQVTHDDATYSDVVVAPDGTVAYGLRSSYAYPSEVVRIDLAGGEVTRLSGPVERPELPGRLEEVETTTADGVRVRGWLALPDSAGPAPLLLWVHGGPLGSWNAWTWRWNPWLMVAQGYAVLLPDPALSTGYGQDFIQRGWGAWGKAPYTDLMAVTDAVEAREDIDATRTAAMGGSFGGYMANWIAGHTDRFKAVVTHASLWALDGFGPTTDAAFYWQREMTEEMGLANSPHLHVGDIVTPMLVIHGDKDYRVPIGEGLRLWYDLLAHSGLPAAEDGSTVHRFLYFPHENHWILAPQHAKVWYAVVNGFLAQHVLGEEPAELPAVLGRTPATPAQLEAVTGSEEHDD
jgi:dipeptidyl aminopeptidase/acylaminoacyl peptidase